MSPVFSSIETYFPMSKGLFGRSIGKRSSAAGGFLFVARARADRAVKNPRRVRMVGAPYVRICVPSECYAWSEEGHRLARLCDRSSSAGRGELRHARGPG